MDASGHTNLINTLSSLLLFFQVIDYYVKKEMVEITPISLPGHQPNIKVLQHMYLKSKINNKKHRMNSSLTMIASTETCISTSTLPS